MKSKILLPSAMALFLAVTGVALFAAPQRGPAVAQTPPAKPAGGFAAQALSSDDLARIIAEQDPNTFLIDVRTAEEFNSGAIPAAINIPYDVIAANLPTQDRQARIIVYCRSGNRSSQAKATLEALGFANVNNFGALSNWSGKLERR